MSITTLKKLNTDCPVCQNKHFEVISKRVRDSSLRKVVKCKNCGLLQLYPMPTIEEDKKFYDQNLQAKNIKLPTNLKTIRENSLNDTERRANMVSRYIGKNKSVLDIASGYGFFLQKMNNMGYKVTGIEVSEERQRISTRVTRAKVLGVNLLEDDVGLSKFNCITLFHVLEHIKEPVSFLKTVKKHLNNNGKLIIEVPNSNDMLLSACRGYRDFYWQRAHLIYFNAKTLKDVVQKAGFSIVDIFYVQRYGVENFMNWFILEKPQIGRPIFQTKNAYKWLEDYYKKYLSEKGVSDTLILIAKPKIK